MIAFAALAIALLVAWIAVHLLCEWMALNEVADLDCPGCGFGGPHVRTRRRGVYCRVCGQHWQQASPVHR